MAKSPDQDYLNKRITKRKRDKLFREIKKDWDYNMIINNPHLKGNSHLKKVAKGFFQIGDLP